MPTHIDVRTGRWQPAIDSNAAAIEADRRYRQIRPVSGLYEVYMAHNPHMLSFAAMMTGQGELTIGTLRRMVADMPDEWAEQNAPFADGYLAMPFEALMRFGRWEEILAEPEPDARYPLARSLRRYARGVAHAAEGRLDEARAEQEAFLIERQNVPAGLTFGNNQANDLLDVAEGVLAGEILYREGRADEAFVALREAVAREDALRYSEPPDWIQPVRHALGAALLRSGRAEEAEAVYRADLVRLPGNVWSLVGLAGALKAQGRADAGGLTYVSGVEAAMRLQEPADRADVIRELGDLDDATREAIVALGPTVADLVEVRAWLSGPEHGHERGQPGPVVQRILQVIRAATPRPA
jgi:tetratricopeptide (TPR) repeat protein